jgi:trimethylamine:corrinoid methyltransferase-like protein
MNQAHTAKNMRKVTHYPTIGFRGFRSKWINEGKPTAETQAAKLAKDILTRPNPNAFSKELDQKIKDHIKNLPAGDASWYA